MKFQGRDWLLCYIKQTVLGHIVFSLSNHLIDRKIPIRIMGYWKFLDFVDERGDNLMREWLRQIPTGARAKIQSLIPKLEVLQQIPAQYLKPLRGACSGLAELRVPFGGVQYRPIGFCGPGNDEITLLIGAVEKGGKLPTGACERALRLKRLAESNRKYLCEHRFD